MSEERNIFLANYFSEKEIDYIETFVNNRNLDLDLFIRKAIMFYIKNFDYRQKVFNHENFLAQFKIMVNSIKKISKHSAITFDSIIKAEKELRFYDIKDVFEKLEMEIEKQKI